MKYLFIIASVIFFYSCDKKGTNETTPITNILKITATTPINVKQTSATVNATVVSDGGYTIVSKGVCWNTSPNPTTSNTKTTLGGGLGNFSSVLSGLLASTTYYCKAYVNNGQTTAYSEQFTFSTQPLVLAGNGVTDIDGNSYTTIILGDKEWMVQNLRSSKYKNGEAIPNKVSNVDWQAANNTSLGAWCYYNHTSGYNNTYGKLYNWYAISDSRGLAPAGWHIPSMGEWAVLTAYLGGSNVAGGALKEAGISNWANPNTGATNSVGFTALPGGYRLSNGTFNYFGTWGYFGSSDIGSFNQFRLRNTTAATDEGFYGNGEGISVRCVKD